MKDTHFSRQLAVSLAKIKSFAMPVDPESAKCRCDHGLFSFPYCLGILLCECCFVEE